MQLTLHLPFQPVVTGSLHRVARLAQRIADAGLPNESHLPPEPQLWAELAPDLALRRISRQAEAHHTAATKGRP